eukprot:scaffold160171_cov30-Tisochrysis_lutea.AAC.1
MWGSQRQRGKKTRPEVAASGKSLSSSFTPSRPSLPRAPALRHLLGLASAGPLLELDSLVNKCELLDAFEVWNAEQAQQKAQQEAHPLNP